MEQVYMSLTDFYKQCLAKAKEEKYIWVVSLIARTADAEEIYSQIERKWASLNNLTNSKILFVFSTNGIRKKSTFFTGNRMPWRGEICPFGVVANNNKLFTTSFMYEKRHANYWPEGVDWKDIHSQSITEFAREFGIDEKQIPCILFYNLRNDEQNIIKITEEFDVYLFLKEIVENIDSQCEAIQKLEEKLCEYSREEKYYFLEKKLKDIANENKIYGPLIEDVLKGQKSFIDIRSQIDSRKVRDDLKRIGQWKKQYMNKILSDVERMNEYYKIKEELDQVNSKLQEYLGNIDINRFYNIQKKKDNESGDAMMGSQLHFYNCDKIIVNQDSSTYNEYRIINQGELFGKIDELEKKLDRSDEREHEVLKEVIKIKTELVNRKCSKTTIQDWINNMSAYITIGSALYTTNLSDKITPVINYLRVVFEGK